jgi:pimeloyl-ACP methyl ester carboxylesterase
MVMVEEPAWGIPPGRFVELPGRGTTFVREHPGPAGAPVLMLLHGLGATGGLNWWPVFSALSTHFRVIAIDHRGHGRGIRTGHFRLEDCADDVCALADVLGIERFVPVGYSMGGPIGQLVWARHRERVQGLVLCATSRNFRGRVTDRVEFQALGLMSLVGKLPIRGRLNLGVARFLPVGGNGLGKWAADELSHHDMWAVIEAAQALGGFSSREWIGHIDVPVGVVVTTHDQLVPARRQLKMAQQIPTAVVHPVDGDHLVVARRPRLFATTLLDACQLVARRSASRPAGRVA